MIRLRYSLLLLLFLVISSTNAQELSFFELFTDHAVLQRQVDIPIWGWAKPKAKVTLIFKGKEFKTKADANGKWMVDLPAQPVGGPHVLVASTKTDSIKIVDVYFGDLYLLSGQSNMEWRLRQSDANGVRAQAIADPLIREITVAKSIAEQPEEHLQIATPWRTGTAEQIGEFSGVGSYFAHYLRREVDVPIGLLHSSWGGSRIEAWMSAPLLGIEQDAAPRDLSSQEKAALQTYRVAFGDGQRPPKEDQGESLGYLNSETEYSRWPTITVPGPWENNGYANINGHFYLARYFELTEAQAAADASLQLGAIDDSDWTYVNGKLVGKTYAAYAEERTYPVGGDLLKAGRNVVLIRVEDTGGGGGLTAASETVKLMTSAGEIPLAGNWHYQIGSWSVDQQYNQVPTILYNKMIHPLAKLPLAGILWYQGESNAGPGSAEAYAAQFQTMITGWRSHFAKPDLPFYWVQLANFQEAQQSADETGWGILRASQTAALKLPNTGEAVIIDIGEAADIHPKNKWEVGRRLSLHALKNIYGKDKVNAASPILASVEPMGRNVKVTFTSEKPLEVRNDRYGYPRGFVYRNQKNEWKWARADLMSGGKAVILHPQPNDAITAIRYGYANNPADANLYSTDGLPLTPFSIDLN